MAVRELRLLEKSAMFLLGIIFVLLVLPNLETYPRTWFDEGVFLQAPKNLILYGKYAVRSSEGFRMFDPILGTGPTVLVPIALVFKLLGIGLVQARLVLVAFLALLVYAFYSVTSRIYGRQVALVASLLFIVTPHYWVSPAVLGRQVLGEVPALLFFLVAALLWYKSLEANYIGYLVGCGFFLGLAMLTKPQYLIVIPPFLAGVWCVSRLFVARMGWRNLLVPMVIGFVCVAFWYGFQLAIIGFPQFMKHISVLRSDPSATLTISSPARALESARSLFALHLFRLETLGLVYVAFAEVRNRRWSAKWLFLFAFVVAWLCWYVFFSIGWIRYAFPVFAIGNIFLAKLFFDLSNGFDISLSGQKGQEQQGNTITLLKNLGITILLSIIILVSLQHRAKAVFLQEDDTPQQFAQYITTFVAPDKVIESYEWEIAFLTNHEYHHPPVEILTMLKAHLFLGAPYSPNMYDFARYFPNYIVVGEFAKWTGLYPEDFLRDDCTLVTSIGEYDLWEVNR